jgi:hypothetical protein
VQETSAKEDEVQRVVDVSGLQKVMAAQEDVQMQGDVSAGAASADFESSLSRARGGGTPLGAKVRGQMESAMGADFSGVKVHTDNRSDHLNRSIQAKAFTTGNDIFFQQGAYNPSSSAGQALIAHELTHTIQQGAARAQVQRNVDPALIDAVENLGTGTLEEALQEIQDNTLTVLKAYNTEIKSFLEKIDKKAFIPTLKQFQKIQAKLSASINSLQMISSNLEEKKQANKKEPLETGLLSRITGEKTKKKKKQAEANEHLEKCKTSINALWKSVGKASEDLKKKVKAFDGEFREDVYKDDQAVDITSFTPLGKGNCNEVLVGTIDDTEDKWVWKADESQFGGDGADKAGLSNDHDINMGSRNIAMAKLDEILGTGVIPETKRAHNAADDTAGTLMKLVGSTALANEKTIEGTGTNGIPKEKELVASEIDYTQSIMQEKLSNLQLLDAICGQIDRHGGNVRVTVDAEGKVVQVWGIDNDFAFGTEITADPDKPISKHRGYPKWVSSNVAQNILNLEPGRIGEALSGLLTPAEIAKTEERFKTVKDYIMSIRNTEQIVEKDNWNEETYKAQIEEGYAMARNKNSPILELEQARDELDKQSKEYALTSEEWKEFYKYDGSDPAYDNDAQAKMREKVYKFRRIDDELRECSINITKKKGELYGFGESDRTKVSQYTGSYLLQHSVSEEDLNRNLKQASVPNQAVLIELDVQPEKTEEPSVESDDNLSAPSLMGRTRSRRDFIGAARGAPKR